MSTSDYLEAAWLNTCRGGGSGVTFTAPAAVYVQLHLGDPGETCTANQASNTTRQAISFAAAASGAGTMTSNTDAQWLSVPSGETYSYFSLWDAPTSGNALGSGPLTSPTTVNPGDNFRLPSSTVVWTLT